MGKEPNLHAGHRQRMKERFLEQGSTVFSDHQLLEMLLFYAVPRKDTNPIAHRLMNNYGSLFAVMNAPVEELKAIPGMTENAAVLLQLLPNLLQRYRSHVVDSQRRVDSIEQAADYLRPYFFGARVELVYLLALDDAGRILGCDCLSEGNVNRSWMDSRAMAQCVLQRKATGVVLAHCHPIGTKEPSEADVLTTLHCRKLLRSLNVQLIDHLVFADDAWCSMAKMNLLD